MQITRVFNKKVLAVAVGLALAVGFSAPAQAYGNGYRYYSHGCSTCGYKYRTYRHHGCSNCYYKTCNTCNYNYNSCNSCGYSCSGCGYGYHGGYYY